MSTPPTDYLAPPKQNHSVQFGVDPAEAQLLGESHSQNPTQARPVTMDLAGHQYDEDDGYSTDPPAHYPKPGHGLMRTLPPESEDANLMIDKDFDREWAVFSHHYKGDGSGIGPDGTLDGMTSDQRVA